MPSVEKISIRIVHQLQQAWVQSRFQRVARTLPRGALQASSASSAVDEFSLISQPDRRFLNFYGDDGIRTALRSYGLLADFHASGLTKLEIETDINDDRHALTVTALRKGQTNREMIIQLLMRRDILVPDKTIPDLKRTYELLVIDWLLLQHPGRSFKPNRTRLPGQKYPGLGLGIKVMEIFARMASRLKVDGVITTGEYFHNAFMYKPRFLFFSPCDHGVFRALRRTLMRDERLSLSQASWAIRKGFVYDHNAQSTFSWKGAAQIQPRSRSLQAFLRSEKNEKHSLKVAAEQHFSLNRSAFHDFWDQSFATDPNWGEVFK